jgi:ssDNA-specific exonuclease RecJ
MPDSDWWAKVAEDRDRALGETVLSEPKVRTLSELLDYVERHADAIYVRHQVNGKWGNYRLSDLPARDALHWAFEWIKRNTDTDVTPARIRIRPARIQTENP